MIRAKDLRIGNWLIINNGTEFEKVHEVIWHNLGLDPTHLVGIPLTEEWLIKLGFEKEQNTGYANPNLFFWYHKNIAIFVDDDGLLYLGYDNNEYYECISINNYPIQFVHELQNLYHALTGEEFVIT